MLPEGRYAQHLQSQNGGSPDAMFSPERQISNMMPEQFIRAGSMAFMCTKLPIHHRSNKTLPDPFKVDLCLQTAILILFYYAGQTRVIDMGCSDHCPILK